MVALLASLLSLLVLPVVPVGASGQIPNGTTVQYTNVKVTPAPPSSSFAGAQSGDGWGLSFSADKVYNVFHHAQTLQVDCHSQATGASCGGGYPKTVTDGSGNNFATPGMPATYLKVATGILYVWVTRINTQTAGVVAIDTTSANANPFVSFTATSNDGDAPSVPYSGVSNPVMVGTKMYAFNAQVSTSSPSGTMDTVMCFDTATNTECAGSPWAVALGGDGSVSGSLPAPAIVLAGTEIAIPEQSSQGNGYITCFDTVSDGTCAGQWPISAPSDYQVGSQTDFPSLNASGQANGFCFAGNTTDTCYDLTGANSTQPAGMAAAIQGSSSTPWNGDYVAIGSRIYVPLGCDPTSCSSSVACYDFAANAGCANFPVVPTGPFYLYSVNLNPFNPGCLWVNSDSGSSQIQNFDAYSGGSCSSGGRRILMSTYIEPIQTCQPQTFTTLQITDPAPTAYTNGTVQFDDASGNALAGVPTQTLDATGSIDLSQFGLLVSEGLAQVVINLPGAETSPITMSLGWTGGYDPACTADGQNPAYVDPAPTITSINPSSGTTAGGTSVTVHGTGFLSGAVLTIGGQTCTNVAVVSSTELTCTTPAGSAGPADVTVTNPDTQSATLTGGYTYTVTNVQPFRLNTVVYFANASWVLNATDQNILRVAAAAIAAHHLHSVAVVGYCSSPGGDGYNKNLGMLRAQNTVTFLRAQFKRLGYAGATMSLQSRGASQFVNKDTTAAQNRRATVSAN